jgi:iron complex transport system substrate-binding protein
LYSYATIPPTSGQEFADFVEFMAQRKTQLLQELAEVVCELGLGDELVGVTHECDFPAFVTGLPKVTRTLIPHDATSRKIDALVRDRLKTLRALYTLDMPTLERLQPDLIVTQALCEVCAVAEAEVTAAVCMLPGHPRVVNLEPICLDDVLNDLRLVARAAGQEARGELAVHRLQQRIDAVAGRSRHLTTRPRVVLLEWIDPPFCCGQPSRSLRWEEVVAAQPDVLMIACCGFSVERTLADFPILFDQPGWDDLPAVKSGRVFVVDGSAYFSRLGPRLVDSLEILSNALHPNVHPLPAGLPAACRIN